MIGETSGNGSPHPFPDPPRHDARTVVRLAHRALAGDLPALEALVRSQEPILKRLLSIRAGLGRAELESLDLVRDLVLFVSPVRREPRTAPGVSLWLCDLLHQRIRAQAEPLPMAADSATRGSTEDRDASADRLDACVARLEEKERDVILLREYLGASWEEIQEELDLSAELAQGIHFRARLRLGQEMGVCHGESGSGSSSAEQGGEENDRNTPDD